MMSDERELLESCSHVLSSGGHVITITLTMTRRLTLIIRVSARIYKRIISYSCHPVTQDHKERYYTFHQYSLGCVLGVHI